MPLLTLNQAAKAAKKSKAALLDAIKNGRLSAPKDELGRYQIDPAELFRVYPPNQPENQQENRNRPPPEPRETGILQATVEHLRELLRQVEGERDDLRRRLDTEGEERRRVQSQLTALLTDQREKPAPEALPPASQPPAAIRPWVIALVAAAMAGVAALAVSTGTLHPLP